MEDNSRISGVPPDALLAEQMSICARSHVLGHDFRVKAAHALQQLTSCFRLRRTKPRLISTLSALQRERSEPKAWI